MTDVAPAHGLLLTPPAVDKLRRILDMEKGENPIRLRVAVLSGGCSGLQYDMAPDEQLFDGDLVVDFDGLEVVVDKKSAPYLSGAEVSYEETMMEQKFIITNPNAQGTCACGNSFH